MPVTLAYKFPPFDTGLFDNAELLMSGGNAKLIIKVADHPSIILQFERVRWHEFTASDNCSADQINTAFLKLVTVDESERLAKYVVADKASRKAYKVLRHFRVFLDGQGCHELFAQSFSAAPESGQWPQVD